MTDTQGGEATAVDTTAAAEAVVLSQDTVVTRDFEAEAREQGWRPKEEWSGKPENWKDAKTYVEHGDVAAKIAKIEKDYEKRFERMEKMHGKTVEMLQREHAKELADLKADRREAIKAGDVDKAEKLDEQIEELKEAGPEKPLTGKELVKHNEQVQADWIKANTWYESDEDMAAYALGVSQRLAAKDPNITIEDNLAKVDEAMRKKYPDYFGGKKTTGANGHAPVDSGGDFTGAPPARKDSLFAKLSPEAKAQCSKDVKAGLYKDNESWAKVYFS
jgi:hypothetical protein